MTNKRSLLLRSYRVALTAATVATLSVASASETLDEETAASAIVSDTDGETGTGSRLPRQAVDAKSAGLGKTYKPGKANSPLQRSSAPTGSAPAATISVAHRRPTDSTVARVHSAILRGETQAARNIYEQVLHHNPRDVDALTGLALLLLRQGETSSAKALIAKALVIAPRNGLAHALAANFHDSDADPSMESKLGQLLADQPDAHPVSFALGNLYARQGRWREAQQEYFRATVGDPGHPDYLFNLAVSLEHIRQPQAARQYYSLALAATGARPAAFNPALATNRIAYLEQTAP